MITKLLEHHVHFCVNEYCDKPFLSDQWRRSMPRGYVGDCIGYYFYIYFCLNLRCLRCCFYCRFCDWNWTKHHLHYNPSKWVGHAPLKLIRLVRFPVRSTAILQTYQYLRPVQTRA